MSTACRPPQKMADQPSYDPLEQSAFFADGMSARPPVPGTIARGQLPGDPVLITGKAGNDFVSSFPLSVDQAIMRRGRERFEIYCSPCHGRVGTGDGMIVQRGYRRPNSFHDPNVRQQPHGYYFDVMTNGFASMPAYGGMISVRDRWAIVAYIRALQLSQNATVNEVPPSERSGLAGGAAP